MLGEGVGFGRGFVRIIHRVEKGPRLFQISSKPRQWTSNGQALAYVYGHADERDGGMAKLPNRQRILAHVTGWS